MKNPGFNRRLNLLDMALFVQLLSVGWITVEAALSAVAANATGSLSMGAFSIDSGIELFSALTLAVRLWVEKQNLTTSMKGIERVASGLVGSCLFLLAAYISLKAGRSFAYHPQEQTTLLGLAVALTSSVLTPFISIQKRRLGVLLHSPSLIADAACNMTCAYMSYTLLVGQLLERTLGWWWVDPLAALGILYFVLQEAWEAVHSAWYGDTHSHAHTH